jgi:hypothetical protein
MAKSIHLASCFPACCNAKGVPMTFTFCLQNVTCKKCLERWNARLAGADFVVEDHGSVWRFTASSEAAVAFSEANLDLAPWQILGRPGGLQGDCLVFAVDHRPAAALTGALIDEGFVVYNRYQEPLRVLDNRTIVAGTDS